MTYIHWARAVPGNFATASNWIGDHVPGASDVAILDPTTTEFGVTSTVDETVDVIRPRRQRQSGYRRRQFFTAIAGTGSGVNAGAIGVYDGASLRCRRPSG